MPSSIVAHEVTALLAVVALFGQPGPRGEPPLDFSGVRQFWQVVETCAADAVPTESQWQELFATPAYRYLVDVNRREMSFRRDLPLAFMPSKRADLHAAMGDGTYASRRYLPHFIEARMKKADLVAFQQRLERENVLQPALARAAEFLPAGVVKAWRAPHVAFAIFEPDAYGDSAHGIVIDLLFATKVNLVNLIGHEAHHYFVHKISSPLDVSQSSDDYFLVHAIDQLRLEGVADWIDKADAFDLAADGPDRDRQEWRANYRRFYEESANRFAQFDALIASIAEDRSLLRQNGSKAWGLLPQGGHPQGFFMSRTIVDVLGKQALIDGLNNPFEFLRLYNRAAARASSDGTHGVHVFSEKTMKVFDAIEKARIR